MTKHYQTSRTPVFNIHTTTWRHLFIRHWRISIYDCQEVLQSVGRPSILSYKMRTVIVTYKLTRSIEDTSNSHHKYHNTQVPQQHGKPLRGVWRKKQRKQNTNNERNAIVTCKNKHASQTSLMHGWHSSEQQKGWKVGVGGGGWVCAVPVMLGRWRPSSLGRVPPPLVHPRSHYPCAVTWDIP